jgi:hypothetical protein
LVICGNCCYSQQQPKRQNTNLLLPITELSSFPIHGIEHCRQIADRLQTDCRQIVDRLQTSYTHSLHILHTHTQMGYCYCRRYTIVFSWIVLAGLLFGFRTCTSAAAAASTSTATDESVHQDSTGTAGVAKSSTVVSTMAFEEWLSVHKSRTQKAQEQPQAGDSHRDYPHYATLEEFFFRHRIYEENLVRWNKLNEIPGGARYGPETEAHADCTIEEFARIVGSCYRERESGSNRTDESVSNSSGNRQSLQPPIQRRQQQQRNRNRLRPQSSKKSINAFTTHHLLEPFTIMDIDWREHAPPAVPPESSSSSKPISYVTPVKNQGPHGTCWSFGAAENLEGLAVQQGHPLQNISEQEFISCCDDCQGRSADHTFEWLLEATGGVPALEDT